MSTFKPSERMAEFRDRLVAFGQSPVHLYAFKGRLRAFVSRAIKVADKSAKMVEWDGGGYLAVFECSGDGLVKRFGLIPFPENKNGNADECSAHS